MTKLNDKIKEAESNTNINPTESQKEKGNYKKGKVTVKGLRVTIENPVGSIRSGKDNKGKEWKIKMPISYGYINRTIGKDNEQVDVYLNKDMEHDFDIYIVDQVCINTKAFDEHKIMLGFKDADSAKKAYMKCYEKNWKGFGSITRLSLNKFKSWLTNKQMLKIPANKLNLISKIDMIENKTNERICVIKMFGEVSEGKTLNDLKKQAGSSDNFDNLVLEIASPGGSVSEGLEIMMWLEGMSQLGKTVTTVVVANAYSIASLIMLVANVKLISKHGKVMVHNPMIPELTYANANDLEERIVELRNLETQMYELYQAFTGLEHATIKKLMDEESYLLPEEAEKYGFADKIIDIEPKKFQMAQTNKKEIDMSKAKNILNTLNRVIHMVNNSEFVNQLYYDNEGGELEIFQKDPASIKVGDRTSLEEGVKTLADGSVVTIKDFVITDITKAVEPTEEELKAKADEEELEAKAKVEADELEAKAKVDEDEKVAKAKEDEEMKSKADEEMKAKADEEMKAKEDAEAKAKSDEDEKIAKAKADEDDKIKAQFNEGDSPTKDEFDALVNSVESLVKANEEMKALIAKGSDTTATQIIENKEFEEIATAAIEAIGKNVSTDFKPEAKAIAGKKATGSIFQQIKKERGL